MGFYRPKNRPKKGKPATRAGFNQIQADRTGLEPATSAVTGRHSNQLNYRSNYPMHECLIKNHLSFIFRDGKDRGFAYFVKKVFHLFSGKE
jgi:hypothetical protein